MLGRVLVTSGVFIYNDDDPSSKRSIFGFIDLIVFFGGWGIMEAVFQYHKNSNYKPNDDSLPIMSIKKFT